MQQNLQTQLFQQSDWVELTKSIESLKEVILLQDELLSKFQDRDVKQKKTIKKHQNQIEHLQNKLNNPREAQEVQQQLECIRRQEDLESLLKEIAKPSQDKGTQTQHELPRLDMSAFNKIDNDMLFESQGSQAPHTLSTYRSSRIDPDSYMPSPMPSISLQKQQSNFNPTFVDDLYVPQSFKPNEQVVANYVHIKNKQLTTSPLSPNKFQNQVSIDMAQRRQARKMGIRYKSVGRQREKSYESSPTLNIPQNKYDDRFEDNLDYIRKAVDKVLENQEVQKVQNTSTSNSTDKWNNLSPKMKYNRSPKTSRTPRRHSHIIVPKNLNHQLQNDGQSSSRIFEG